MLIGGNDNDKEEIRDFGSANITASWFCCLWRMGGEDVDEDEGDVGDEEEDDEIEGNEDGDKEESNEEDVEDGDEDVDDDEDGI